LTTIGTINTKAYGFNARITASVAIAANAAVTGWVTTAFPGILSNSAGGAAPVGGTFTAGFSGWYSVTAALLCTANNTIAKLHIGATPAYIFWRSTNAGDSQNILNTVSIPLAAGTAISLVVDRATNVVPVYSSGNFPLATFGQGTYWSVQYIGGL
jgi:hypothetical protein